jgi:hypothetical protein
MKFVATNYCSNVVIVTILIPLQQIPTSSISPLLLSSYPSGFVAQNTNGAAELKTTVEDPAIQGIIANITLTNAAKTEAISNEIQLQLIFKGNQNHHRQCLQYRKKDKEKKMFHTNSKSRRRNTWYSTAFWMKISTELFFYYLVSFIIIFLNDTFDLSSCACSPI